MRGYYTYYSFVVIEYEDPYDTNVNPILRQFATYEEACEYYNQPIDIIAS